MTERNSVQLDGAWALILKICLVVIPVFGTVTTAAAIPWIRWITEVGYRQQETRQLVDAMMIDLRATRVDLSSLPARDLAERIKQLEIDSRHNITDHNDLKIGQTEIRAGVDQIKEKLGVLKPNSTQ